MSVNLDPSDPDAFINQIHVPEDAGEYAENLRKILSRVPLRWGRWISCDKGWYPLVIELDEKLAEIYPDYQLHQVKEKFGTLRYYIGFPDLDPQCCIDFEAKRPVEGPVNPEWLRNTERTLKEQYELDMWFADFNKHLDSEEHRLQGEALEPERERRYNLSEHMHKIIDEYENLSAKTCELCGAEAVMQSRGYWYKTLCSSCAETHGYSAPETEDDSI